MTISIIQYREAYICVNKESEIWHHAVWKGESMENTRIRGFILDENRFETNRAAVQGTVLTEMAFSHKSYGECFYLFTLGIKRRSGYEDEIKVIISERLICNLTIMEGKRIRVEGQIRTYNEEEKGKSHLNVVIFARAVSELNSEEYDENSIYLEGFVCKQPVQRMSPLGRNICDIMLAVNRMYNKSDYIPCIAWGRNAAYAGNLEVGKKLCITGRIQSREYKKHDEEGNAVMKTAYEVSILKIEE